MGYRTYTCPHARSCGGCEWLAVPYPIQLQRKQEAVERELGAMVEEDGGDIAPILGMDDPRAYRHKCATPFAPGKGGRIRSGFYVAGTHRIVKADACLVEHPLGRDILGAVARQATKLGIPAYHEDSGTGCLRHAIVRLGYATNEALLAVVTNGRTLPRAKRLAAALMHEFPQLVGIVQSVNTTRGNAMLGRECHTLAGRATMRDALLGCAFEIGATSFYQTNPAQTEVLYRVAIDAALGLDGTMLAKGGEHGIAGKDVAHGCESSRTIRLLDAYCGCGTIGICAAARGADAGIDVRVAGVERVGPSITLARRNAKANGLAGACAFVSEDATAYLRKTADGALAKDRLGERAMPFDVVVLDPPRAGSTPEFLAATAALAPRRIVYVSCNVITQARDLALTRASGYRIAAVTPVDLFPHTKHVESIVLLSRDGGGNRFAV